MGIDRAAGRPNIFSEMNMVQQKMLEDFVLHTLKDNYIAEKHVLKTRPKMAKAANSPALEAGFEQHLEQILSHVGRLEPAFEINGAPARDKICEAILGGFKGNPALDAGFVSSAHSIAHYRIARHGQKAAA